MDFFRKPKQSKRLSEMASPFNLGDEASYQAWRAQKLSTYPQHVQDLIIEVADPRHLTAVEHAAILDRCRRTNMAIYASAAHAEADKDLPRRMGEHFGLRQLDHNLLADEDAISILTVAEEESGPRGDYIPYTNKAIRWHSDGYYNPSARRICGFILHCVQDAESGGENRLLDPDIAYILLRDENPDYVRALSAMDAMTIPARMDEDKIARAAESGPVFSVLPTSGALHMRYTARTKSIVWKDNAETRVAVSALEHILGSESPYIFQARLAPGMGLICNNILHDRTGFNDSDLRKRVIFRARYHDRMQGCEL
jgi:alpha-ketoglutarate-dependent taurine dioxygenase